MYSIWAYQRANNPANDDNNISVILISDQCASKPSE